VKNVTFREKIREIRKSYAINEDIQFLERKNKN